MLLCFEQHDIIPPMAWNLRLEDPRTIKKFNDTLLTSFLKNDIYHRVHYLHNRDIYPLPTHLARAFERLYKLITRIMYVADKKCRSNITGRVKWSPEYDKAVDLVELWVLLKDTCEDHHYNVRKLTQLQQQFPHVISGVNEVAIITRIQYACLEIKITKNQSEALRIEYRTNLAYALKEVGTGPSSIHVRNIQ